MSTPRTTRFATSPPTSVLPFGVVALDHRGHVPKGAAGKVVDAAKEAGAEGGTILLARGTGVHEARRFFGMSMSTEREMLIIDPGRSQEMLDSMVRASRRNEPGRGMAFVLSVDEVKGTLHREPENDK